MSEDIGLRLGIVPLRPLNVPDLLRGALDAVRRHPGALLGIGFAVAVVGELAARLAVLVAFGGDPAGLDLTGHPGSAFPPFAASLLRTAVFGLVGIVLAAVVNTVVPRAVFGHTTRASAALRAGSPSMPALLGVAVLTGLLVGAAAGLAALGSLAVAISPLGLVLALPPLGLMLYLSVVLLLAPPVAVVERLGPVAALRRSRELVHDGAGGWWRVFGVALIASLVGMAIKVAVYSVFDAISGGTAFADTLGAILVATLVTPWTLALHALLYVDARYRVEGSEGLWRAAG
jgi:hypothetical protein